MYEQQVQQKIDRRWVDNKEVIDWKKAWHCK